jgi:hypothetical protein
VRAKKITTPASTIYAPTRTMRQAMREMDTEEDSDTRVWGGGGNSR